MYNESIEVVADRDAGRCTGVEARQLAVLQWEAVVQPHQLHEHVGYQDTKIFDVAGLVLDGHHLDVGIKRLRLRWRSIILLLLLLLLLARGRRISLDGGRECCRLRGYPRLRLLWAFRGCCFCVGEGFPPLCPALV